MKLFLNTFTAFFMVGAISCSSIVSKSTYPVVVKSAPSGLKYSIKNKAGSVVSTGRTPSTVSLNAKAGFFKAAKYQIDILEGSRTVGSTELTATIDGWYLGNILFGGLIGLLIVDPATGNMWALPDEVTVHKNTLASTDAPQLNVALLSSLTEQQRQKLVKIKSR